MIETRKIMVVDDEPFICEIMEEFLSMYGHKVTVKTSGEDAISEFTAINPDMVLLDIWMPGMNGLEVLRKIRQLNKGIKVIMLSAFGDEDTVDEAIKIGADYYLQKPIEFKRLLKIIQE